MRHSLFQRPQARFTVKAAAEPEIFVYDEIGFFGIKAQDFVRELKAVDAERIHLRINSPGGDLPDAIAIYNALRAHPAEIIVHVDALAASSASLIAMAGTDVRIAPNAFFMVHNAWALTVGNAEDHRETATILDKMDSSALVAAYVKKTGRRAAVVEKWMAEETWFTADEAIEAGLADRLDQPSEAKADFDLSVFRHAPAALAVLDEDEPTIRMAERALRDAGFSRTAAKAVLAEGWKAIDDRNDPMTTLRRDAERAELLAESRRVLSTLSGGAGVCPTN